MYYDVNIASGIMIFTTCSYTWCLDCFIVSRAGKMQKTKRKRRGNDKGCLNKKKNASKQVLKQRE
jgi:hypothetical protein